MLLSENILTLCDELCQPGLNIYVLVDGARSDEMTELLRTLKADAEPLLKPNAERDLTAVGPWMLCSKMEKDETLKHLRFADAFGGATCWVGDCARDNALAHFRRLNAARMPNDRLVFFRHYDPDVLASVLPICDEHQTAKIFGPFACVGFIGGRNNGSVIVKPVNLPETVGGPIGFTSAQIDQLNRRQEMLLRDKIGNSLRVLLPNKAGAMTDREMSDVVDAHFVSGKLLGVHSERGFAHWSYLNLATDSRMAGDLPALRSILLTRHESIDQGIEKDFNHILAGYKKYVDK